MMVVVVVVVVTVVMCLVVVVVVVVVVVEVGGTGERPKQPDEGVEKQIKKAHQYKPVRGAVVAPVVRRVV